MTETLAPHERLALYNLTDEEIEKIEEELVKHFPREEFAEIHIEAVSYTHLTLPTNREV